MNGSAFLYFGDQVDRFRAAFADQGLIMFPDTGEAAPKPGLVAGLCQQIGDGTLVGLSPDSDETSVEITGDGGEYVWLTTLVNTEVVGMRRPVRTDAVDQVLTVIGIEPKALTWQFMPGAPLIGLRQMLVEAPS